MICYYFGYASTLYLVNSMMDIDCFEIGGLEDHYDICMSILGLFSILASSSVTA